MVSHGLPSSRYLRVTQLYVRRELQAQWRILTERISRLHLDIGTQGCINSSAYGMLQQARRAVLKRLTPKQRRKICEYRSFPTIGEQFIYPKTKDRDKEFHGFREYGATWEVALSKLRAYQGPAVSFDIETYQPLRR